MSSLDAVSAGVARLSAMSTAAAQLSARSAGAARLSAMSTAAARPSARFAGAARPSAMSTSATRPEVILATRASDGIPLGFFEVERLVLGLFGAGSGVLLLGTSSSRIISLLLD